MKKRLVTALMSSAAAARGVGEDGDVFHALKSDEFPVRHLHLRIRRRNNGGGGRDLEDAEADLAAGFADLGNELAASVPAKLRMMKPRVRRPMQNRITSRQSSGCSRTSKAPGERGGVFGCLRPNWPSSICLTLRPGRMPMSCCALRKWRGNSVRAEDALMEGMIR